MAKCKQTKLLKAVSKGKVNRVTRLCGKLGYGPETVEELVLRAVFNAWTPRDRVSLYHSR